MRVLFVASEAVPLAKTGGLGDVVSALAAALRRVDVDAGILLPGYPEALELAGPLTALARWDDLPGGPGRLMMGRLPDTDLPVLLFENPALYAREGTLYQDPEGRDFADNALRFGALCHAATRIATGRSAYPRPDVVHVHDWHAGLVPLLMRRAGSPAKSLLTVHNLAFHGSFPFDVAPGIGMDEEDLRPESAEFWGQLSFLKAGLVHAHRITTVSKSYAAEILTPAFGCGFDGLLNARRELLSHITNGIDMQVWDPASDPHLPRHFSAEDPGGKHAAKRALQQLYGLPVEPFAPILAMGSRLTTQKMADVAIEAIGRLLQNHPRLQAVVLGRGAHELEDGYRMLEHDFRGRLGLHIGYDEHRAHLMHAGADMLLHGSRFEPCGLTPLYAMRYGSVPIASRVGGLIDNIVDAGEGSTPAPGATGFLFDGATVDAMSAAVERALARFADPKAWRALQQNGMRHDFGWEQPAARYAALYRSMLPQSRLAGERRPRAERVERRRSAERNASPAVQAAAGRI